MRQILAVVVSFVAMSMLVFGFSIAPWFLLGLDAVMLPGRFVTVGAYDVYAVLVSVGGALLAGWLCAAIGRSRAAVLTLAFVALAAGLMNAVAQRRKPEPPARVANVAVPSAMAQRRESAWFTLLVPFSGAVAIVIGGRRAATTRTPGVVD